MYLFITILILIAAVLLVLIVLVQNSKGGGLASGFSSSNQIMGVRKTTDFLEKATWTLAGTIIILSIAATAFLPKTGDTEDSAVNKIIKTETQSLPAPTLPAPTEAAPQGPAPIVPAPAPAQ